MRVQSIVFRIPVFTGIRKFYKIRAWLAQIRPVWQVHDTQILMSWLSSHRYVKHVSYIGQNKTAILQDRPNHIWYYGES